MKESLFWVLGNINGFLLAIGLIFLEKIKVTRP